MSIETRNIEFDIDGKTYEGVLAFNTAQSGERPAVLVAHAWGGRSDFEVGKAKALAELGYVGFAIDLYGKGVLGTSAEENEALMTPLVSDRPMLQSRLLHIVDLVKGLPEVNSSKVAAAGFCFGGLCVLDIARTGADLNGVISLHGLLGAPGNTEGNKIKASVLVLHGWDDPMAPPADVEAFSKEMNAAGADWQLHAYGGTMHSFTNPAANDPDFGTVYNANADKRSWKAMANFLDEIFE